MSEHNPTPIRTNRLADQSSPYLLQHSRNPVNWYPWGDEAFEKAAQQDKPIFLSIGYSTCHWCHVMERESFEDEQVAAVMNEAYVSIKVDREERPDLDNLYMTVCQMLTGQGGWPLTILMTPDKKPFFAGTYLPKQSAYGRVGLIELTERVSRMWKSDRQKVLGSANEVVTVMQKLNRPSQGAFFDEATLQAAYRNLGTRFDKRAGGFSDRPKFPTPHNLTFLLRYAHRHRESDAPAMVEKTLVAMRAGGLFDQVGLGFHRYSTDENWLVPHFEKMLYDQALLAIAYTEAFQVTGHSLFEQTVREVFTYVLRDLTDKQGAFFSAEDADSEGEEGKFYTWTVDQINQLLRPEEHDLYADFFNIHKEGNFFSEHTGGKTGANIPHQTRSPTAFARERNLPEHKVRAALESASQKLFAARELRTRPHLDDKILTDWNGLMIAAMAKASRALDEPRFRRAAERATDFLLHTMKTEDGRLLHRYRRGVAGIPGQLDDYAFLTWGLLELYESTFNVRYLQEALALTDILLDRFLDREHGGFFLIANDAEKLLLRPKDAYDGALPSGNSVAMLNLLRLSRITANPKLEQVALDAEKAFSATIARDPSAFTQFLSAVDFRIGPTFEIVIVGEAGQPATRKMAEALGRRFVPNTVVLHRPAGEKRPAIVDIAPYTEHQAALGKRTTAYVCSNQSCKPPTHDIPEMLDLLDERASV